MVEAVRSKLRVTEITFEVVVNGLRRVATYKKPEKIAGLLSPGNAPLDQFLRDLVEMKPEKK